MRYTLYGVLYHHGISTGGGKKLSIKGQHNHNNTITAIA